MQKLLFLLRLFSCFFLVFSFQSDPGLQDTNSGRGKVKQTEPMSPSNMLLVETAEPSDDAIIVPSSSSVDVTDVSRMGFDLRRKTVVGDRNKVDPEEADKRFVELFAQLLEKVCMLSNDLFWSRLTPSITVQ